MFLATLCLFGCSADTSSRRLEEGNRKTLIYFGFDNHSEKREDILKLAKTWGEENKLCAHWQPTANENDEDYKILFGSTNVTILGHRGEILYNGGVGVLYLPHGNPDGSGANICKLTGE